MATTVGLKNPEWDLNRSLYAETDELPLMASPGPMLMIIAMYLLFVLKVGPDFMKKKEAYKLTTIMLLYNIAQVVVSALMSLYFLRGLLYFGLAPKHCYMADEKARNQILMGLWIYFIAKVSELLDTVFFVLRKKDNQITFLHVYHHTIMMVATWAFLKYWPSQSLTFIGFINSLVHVIMYSYYGLSALGPTVAKYLTWKKYLTKLQLVQFVSVIVQYVTSVTRSDCPPAKGVATFVACNTFTFLILFLNFYRQSYNKKSKSQYKDDVKKVKIVECVKSDCKKIV